MIRKIFGIITLSVFNLFIGCSNPIESISPITFELDAGLSVDSNGYYHSGDIGEIRYLYSQRVNLGRIRTDVNAMWNLAPHDISIIQYWLNNQEKCLRSLRFSQC